MHNVNVLVVSKMALSHDYLEDIAAADARISVKDGTEQFIAELQRKGRKGRLMNMLLEEVGREYNRQAPGAQEDLDAMLAQAEVIFGALLFPENLLARAPKLKWIHIGTVGINVYLSTGIFDGNVTVTNSKGSTAIPIAEHAIAFMFMLARNAPRLLDNKQNRRWEQFVTRELSDKTVGIIGLGAIGGEVARLAKGIGMKVLATRKSAAKRESGIFGVDELYPSSDLLQMLTESDFVVVAAALTEETERMIGERELRAMKPTAYVINVARGQIIDQAALIKALKEGGIAGAGLDVFESEPLPPDNELWELPNVILSSHSSAWTDRRSQRVVGLFGENLRRYLAGEQPLNVIDRQKGY